MNRPSFTAAQPLRRRMLKTEKALYVVEGRAQPHRLVWGYNVAADGALSGKTKVMASCHSVYALYVETRGAV